MEHNIIAQAMRESFRNWGKKSIKYKKTFKKLNEGFPIVDAALSEIGTYEPWFYQYWWAHQQNHMRFTKIKETQCRLAHELIKEFLADYSMGRLNVQTRKTKSRAATA